jgi:hypothetical protein
MGLDYEEECFWRGRSEIRFCDCRFKMTQLLNSWVCDRCDPPESSTGTSTECSGGACPVDAVKSDTWYTYSTRSGLNNVASGYKLYSDFQAIRTLCVSKAATKGPYCIYKIEESKDSYVDTSRTQPVSTRVVKVQLVDTVLP